MRGTVGTGLQLGAAAAGMTLIGSGDFDGGGKVDLLWQDTAGNTAIWFMHGPCRDGGGLARQCGQYLDDRLRRKKDRAGRTHPAGPLAAGRLPVWWWLAGK